MNMYADSHLCRGSAIWPAHVPPKEQYYDLFPQEYQRQHTELAGTRAAENHSVHFPGTDLPGAAGAQQENRQFQGYSSTQFFGIRDASWMCSPYRNSLLVPCCYQDVCTLPTK